MWFLRRRRRPQLDLAALDRLSETIGRAVALIEERLAPPQSRPEPRRLDLVIRRPPEWHEPDEREPERPPPEWRPEPERQPELEPEREREPVQARTRRREASTGFVLFVPTTAGYRLVTPDGVTPEPGERLRVDERWYCVVRLGPSPLPADRRRCAFLEAATLTE